MITEKTFDAMPDGREVKAFTIVGKDGFEVEVCEFGGTITKIMVKDKNGKIDDVNLSVTTVNAMSKDTGHLGATIGRNAGRITPLEQSISGTSFKLADTKNGVNLHGGPIGLSKRLFTGSIEDNKIVMRVEIPAFDDNFPGKLNVSVTFSVTEENGIRIDYKAVSDADTIINLTNHAYFNLSGHDGETIDNHTLWVDADLFATQDQRMIFGELLRVKDTAFDFNTPKELKKAFESEEEQIKLVGGGVDHTYYLNHDGFRKVATLSHNASGRVMDVYTTEPTAQVYTANFLNINEDAKDPKGYDRHQGICIETQNTPNAISMPWIKSSIYKKDEVYTSSTEYRFYTI